MINRILFGAVVVGGLLCVQDDLSAQTGYYPRIIARGEDRQLIRSMPIQQRPGRPLHFYGNAVRRNYYGVPLFRLPSSPIFGQSVRQPRRAASGFFFRRW